MASRAVQPARQVLIDRDLMVLEVAEAIDVDVCHLRNALTGRTVPRREVRERLPEYLGMPLEVLFTPETLARNFGGVRGRRGGRRTVVES